ncbi:hypothetical protein F5Y03DRAFT_396775 [Xylaria venustula]|nr:hypothetical protein F5Y03DRAFT_396775 [Xylaria venustula]
MSDRCSQGPPVDKKPRRLSDTYARLPLRRGRLARCERRQWGLPEPSSNESDLGKDNYEFPDMADSDHTVNSGKQGPSKNPKLHQQRGFVSLSRLRHLFPPFTAPNQIIYTGNGTTVAGQSTESFLEKSRMSLCYQCSKQVPLDVFLDTDPVSCGSISCWRTEESGLQFIRMPKHAAEACSDFEVFLLWWIGKVHHGADKTIKNRARARVQEMRDVIP